MAQVSGKVPQRAEVNGEVRKYIKQILKDKRLKKTYKILAGAIVLRIEQPAIKLAAALGVNLA